MLRRARRVFVPPELHRMMTPADKERLRQEQLGHDTDVFLADSDMQVRTLRGGCGGVANAWRAVACLDVPGPVPPPRAQALFHPTVTAIVAQAKKVLRSMEGGCDVVRALCRSAQAPA